jgi:hypothetical protein
MPHVQQKIAKKSPRNSNRPQKESQLVETKRNKLSFEFNKESDLMPHMQLKTAKKLEKGSERKPISPKETK